MVGVVSEDLEQTGLLLALEVEVALVEKSLQETDAAWLVGRGETQDGQIRALWRVDHVTVLRRYRRIKILDVEAQPFRDRQRLALAQSRHS